MRLWFSSMPFEAFTDTVTLESTQFEVSSSSGAGCAVVSMFGSQTVESSCAMMWYSFSRPGMESGGAHWSVTLLGETWEMVRKRGAAGTVKETKRIEVSIHSVAIRSRNATHYNKTDYLIQREWKQYSLQSLRVLQSWQQPQWVRTPGLVTAQSLCTLVCEPGVCRTASLPPVESHNKGSAH